jgi:hypothetical protein
MTSTALAGAPLQATNTDGAVVTLLEGKPAVVDGLKLTLLSVRPYQPGDVSRGTVTLLVGAREVSIGGYAQEARYVDGHLLTKLASSPKPASAQVRVSRLALTVQGAPVTLGVPLAAPPFTVTVNDFFHVDEYGAYFSASLDIRMGGRSTRSNTGEPFSLDGFRFEWRHEGFSRADLVVRPLRLGEDFELLPSESITLEGVRLTLTAANVVSETETRLQFTATDAAGKTHTATLTQRFEVLRDEPPEGKYVDVERRLSAQSQLEVALGPWRLENVVARKGEKAPRSFRLSAR